MNNNLLEALLYVQGEEGVSPKQFKSVMDISTLDARKLLKQFKDEFNKADRGIKVVEYNDLFKFATKEEFKEEITKMVATRKKQKLSNSAIETAGIIAYKQPITKSQINEIRGVSSEGVVNTLLIKGIIEEKGVAKTPGNPIFYGITDKFYDYFGIRTLKELPEFNELNSTNEIDDDFDLYQSQRDEN